MHLVGILTSRFTHDARSQEHKLGKESQESSASTDKTNENEEKTAHPQPTKRQRKKASTKRPGFFMDNIKPTLTVSQTVKVNELVNLTNTQDLYNKTDHKINNLSEQSVHGANESSNNLDKTTSQNLSSKVPSKSKLKIKLSHHLNGLVPLTIYHQNVRGLRGKANKLLSQLYANFPHIPCLSEHHMNHLELQQTFFDNYKLGVSNCELYMKREECAYLSKKVYGM